MPQTLVLVPAGDSLELQGRDDGGRDLVLHLGQTIIHYFALTDFQLVGKTVGA